MAPMHQALLSQSVAEFKEDIAASLSSNMPAYEIMAFTTRTRPSAISLWTKFGQVCTVADHEPLVFILNGDTLFPKRNKVLFVGCHGCQCIYAYNSNIGTSSINNHKCPVAGVAPGSSHSMVNFAKPVCQPNAGQKQLVTRSVGDMCAVDIRPFSIVAGKGFRAMLQNVLDIGVASKNPMKIDDLLQDQVTVKRSLKQRYTKSRDILLKHVQDHFSSGLWAGFTLDIWTDDYHQQSYLSVTIHFIDASFKLHDRTLQVNAFPAVSHTGEAILSEFNSVIEPYRSFEVQGISEKASDEQVVIVSDSASNNCSVDGLPSQYWWDPCCDHKIGTCISTALAKRTRVINGKTTAPFYEFYDEASDLFDMLQQCKDLVTYFKKTDLNSQLTPKLKQEIPTRWYGLLTMLESIRIQFDEARKLLVAKGGRKEKKIDCIDRELLIETVRFLAPFKTATLALESFKTPTLHIVAFWRNSLLDHCEQVKEAEEIKENNITEIIPPDSDQIISIKGLISNQILDKWSLSKMHIMAALLDPRQKSRLQHVGAEEEQIKEAKAEIQRLTEQFAGLIKDDDAQVRRASKSYSRPSRPLKRAKLLLRQAGSLSLASDSDEAPDDDHPPQVDKRLIASLELSEYYALKLSRNVKNDLDSEPGQLLTWWSNVKGLYHASRKLQDASSACLHLRPNRSATSRMQATQSVTREMR